MNINKSNRVIVTILRSDEGELGAEGSGPSRCDGSNDADVGGVRCEGGDGEGGGGGGQLEGGASPNHRHVDDIADDDAISLISRGQSPANGGRARGSWLGCETSWRSTGDYR